MKLQPLNNNVVIRRKESESKTRSGIIIPDNAQQKARHGEVLAVGPGGYDKEGIYRQTTVKPGQVVAFGDWAGTEVEFDGVKYLVIPETQLLGTVEE